MDLLDLENFLPYRLSIASNLVSDVIARAYDELFGLTIPEWRAVAVLAENEGLTQLDIVRLTRMDKMTVSRAVRPLVERKLVLRRPNEEDGRSQLLRLSKTGQVLYAAVVPAARKLEKEMMRPFTKAEIKKLAEALRKLEASAERIAERDRGR